jgi:hypothetical protein
MLSQGQAQLRPKRVNYFLKVHCLHSYNHFDAQAENISMQGICLRTSEPLPTGGDLSVILRLPNQPQPIVIPSRVIWSHALPDTESPKFRCGLRYIYLNSLYRKIFHDFLRVLRDESP